MGREPCGEVQTQFVLIILLLMIILTFVYVKGTRAFWENPNSLLLVDLLSLRIWISSIIRTLFPITRLSARDR